MTPWDFYSNDSGAEFLHFATTNGATNPETYRSSMMDRVVRFICDNSDSAVTRHYEPRPYMTDAQNYEMALPKTVGIDSGSSTEYSWGTADSSDVLKGLVGRECIQRAGVNAESAFLKLVVFMPGHGIPWHRDSFSSWSVVNGEPASNVKRSVLMVSGWHWGHIVQIDNKVLSGWASGSCYDIPAGVWHLTHNHGTQPQIMISLTGEPT
jgi:quercetin dioxygenase-like cupin family protein